MLPRKRPAGPARGRANRSGHQGDHDNSVEIPPVGLFCDSKGGLFSLALSVGRQSGMGIFSKNKGGGVRGGVSTEFF